MRLNDTSDIIIVENVHKFYGSFHALKGVSLRIKLGEVVVIVGPSGSGKSTFIRTINYLEPFTRGKITVDGIALKQGINIDKVRR